MPPTVLDFSAVLRSRERITGRPTHGPVFLYGLTFLVLATMASGCTPRSALPGESLRAVQPAVQDAANTALQAAAHGHATRTATAHANATSVLAQELIRLHHHRALASPSPAWLTRPGVPLHETAPRAATGIDHVLLISVDGIRSDALLALGPEGAPTWHRLKAEGASTLNARTDPRRSYTNPNHLGMITGRPTDGDDGHRLVSNRDLDGVVHTFRDNYTASIWDVTWNSGLRAVLFASKTKFDIFTRSWDADHAAPSPARPGAVGPRVEQENFTDLDDATTHAHALESLRNEAPPHLVFVHYGEPDGVGHGSGFDPTPGSPYMARISMVDGLMGELLDVVETHPRLAGRTAIVLTTDHGGEGRNHFNLEHPANWTIPFVVWGPGIAMGVDLYALNTAERADPGDGIASAADPPPVRNIEAGQVALRLLGLPPVPGSTVGLAPPLRVVNGPDAP